MDLLIDEAVKLAGMGVLAGAMILMRTLLKKLRVQLDQEQMVRLESLARQGILKAEEWAAAALKAKTRTVVSPKEKLETAVLHVMTALPGTSAAQAEAAVLASLPTLHLGASGGQ